jgi:YVTN family beta-propeller protein
MIRKVTRLGLLIGVSALFLVPAAAQAHGGGSCKAKKNADHLGYSTQLRDDKVSILNLKTQKPIGSITGGMRFPFNSEVSPDGGKLYIDNAPSVIGEPGSNLAIYDLCEHEYIKRIPASAAPFSFPSTDGRYILSTVPDGTIFRTDIKTDKVKTYNLPTGTAHAVTSDGEVIWVSTFDGHLYTVDGKTGAQFGPTLTVGGAPLVMTISEDGKRVVTFNLTGQGISIVNTKTRAVANVVTPGSTPAFGEIAPDNRYAWVSDYANFVRVIDMKTNQVVKTIDTGGLAAGMDFWHGRAFASTTDPGTTTAGQGLAALGQVRANTWLPGGRIWVINASPPFNKTGEFSSGGNLPMPLAIPDPDDHGDGHGHHHGRHH